MSNAKRAIMVPVLTLAVCAIAMVGLGFALTTSVTSNTNAVEKLMIDLNSEEGNLGTYVPSTTNSSDSALSFKITTYKDGVTITGGEVKSGYAFLKIYGNTTNITLSVTVSDNGSNQLTKITSLKLSLYEADDFKTGGSTAESKGTTSTAITSQGITGQIATGLTSGTVYVVAITEINGQALQYSVENSVIKGSWTGNTIPLPNSNDDISLKYKFDASVA